MRALALLFALLPGAALAQQPRLPVVELSAGMHRIHAELADGFSTRMQGLMQRPELAQNDGMLFVFGAPTTVGFTMSTVPVGLDIGFYRADGTLVSTTKMAPCAKAENACPVYRADGPFSYALETLSGKLPAGSLSARSCPS